LSGFAKVTRDLTQRLRQDEAMRQRTRELEGFAHTISHDLRAPLRAITSYSEVLLTDHQGELTPEVLKLVERVNKNALSMEEMLSGILRYSQVTIGSYEFEPVPLAAIVEEAVRHHESEIQATGAVLNIQANPPVVYGHRTLLLQIFSNLIGNALKFVPEGRTPEVQISFEGRGQEACVVVRDNGIGVAQKDLDRMFNVFERLESGRKAQGTGVGLAIVKRSVERLGGKIEVNSVVGQGTTFTICVPLYTGEDPGTKL
jgi:signal transduction histidine kinase